MCSPTIQYATNLTPPIAWQTIQTAYSTNQLYQITNATGTSGAGFYRVRAQKPSGWAAFVDSG